jgi:kinesin family protein C1
LYADRKESLIECHELEKSEMAARGELGSAKGQLERVQSELDEEVAASRRALSEQKEEIKTLTEKISEIDAKLKEVTEERNGLEDEVESYHMTKANLEKKLQDAEAAQMESQKYSMNLQEYNSKLQGEVQNLTQQMDDLRGEKARLTEDKASLTGRVQALGDALEALQASSSSTEKARKDAVAELSRLRGELASLSAEKSSLTAELSTVKGVCNEQRSDLERYRAATGKDLVALEEEKANSHMLTQRTKAQAETVAALQDQLTMMKEQRTAAEAHAERLSEENRRLKAKIAEFEVLLPALEERVRDSEAIRRRLHNTVLELKGNVRVFCRVRPLSQEEEDAREKTSLVPVSTGDLSGRGLELENANSSTKPSVSQDKNQQQKHLFTFDRTFGPTSTQEDVFEEVSDRKSVV